MPINKELGRLVAINNTLADFFARQIKDGKISDEDKTTLKAVEQEFQEVIDRFKRISGMRRRKNVRQVIKQTDNVHWKVEFNVPTDVFTAMMDSLSQILTPLMPESLEQQIERLNMIIKLRDILESAQQDNGGETESETSGDTEQEKR